MTEEIKETTESPQHPPEACPPPPKGLEAELSKKSAKAYDIDIFRDWCKSCGICAAFCPRECIRLDENGSPVIEDSERCSGCGWCEVHCPDFAISVHPRRPRKPQQEED